MYYCVAVDDVSSCRPRQSVECSHLTRFLATGAVVSWCVQMFQVKCRLLQVLPSKQLIVGTVDQTCKGKAGLLREETLVCCHQCLTQTRPNRLQLWGKRSHLPGKQGGWDCIERLAPLVAHHLPIQVFVDAHAIHHRVYEDILCTCGFSL